MEIRIKSGTDVPIYQQIVDAVQEQISSGVLAEGQKLPTVRQLAEEMGLAKGTIKRAYDELERCGAIRMTQGKGTFVLELRRRTDSHKEQAMQAIDRMLDELEALDFSPREIEIFFDLKLRARMDRGAGLRVAVTDCNVEALALIADQIAAIGGIELFRFTLDEVMNAPYKLSDSMELIFTTECHVEQLERIVSQPQKIVKLALAPTQATVVSLARMRDARRIGIISASEQYGDAMREGASEVIGTDHRFESRFFGDGDPGGFVSRQDAVLVPAGYMKYCSAEEAEWLHRFSRSKPLLAYELQIDAGSFMYLRDRIEQLQRRRRK